MALLDVLSQVQEHTAPRDEADKQVAALTKLLAAYNAQISENADLKVQNHALTKLLHKKSGS